MTMTDPIVDVLTHLYSMNRTYHGTVSMPYSKLKSMIVNMLVEEGYLASTSVEDARVGKALTLVLKYGSYRESIIKGLQRVSKPDLRMYAKSTNLPKVRGSPDVAILSAFSGLLIDHQAASKGVGGEALVYI